MKTLKRAFSLTWPASMQIYWNKIKRLHKKSVQLPQDLSGTPTWPPFHCFETPIWPPWRHVKMHYMFALFYRFKNHTFTHNKTKSYFLNYFYFCLNVLAFLWFFFFGKIFNRQFFDRQASNEITWNRVKMMWTTEIQSEIIVWRGKC